MERVLVAREVAEAGRMTAKPVTGPEMGHGKHLARRIEREVLKGSMDARQFDAIARLFSAAGRTRRGLLGLLATLPVLGSPFALIDRDEADAKGRRKRRKKAHKHGRPRKHGKRKKKKCKPNSLAKTCAGQCGPIRNNCKKTVDCGSCACATNTDCGDAALCLDDGSCQACTVTCTGTPAECGAALQAAITAAAGDTIYVCPGAYQGGFTITAAVRVIGAGDGDDTASNTILDGNDAARVVLITGGIGTVELERLRITGGAVNAPGAGIRLQGATLLMRDCTVIDNRATGSTGGGIDTAGTLTVTDCLIEGNNATFGGGISQFGGLTTLAGSTEVRGNASTQRGAGIYVQSGTLEIGAACRVTDNTAPFPGDGGGIANISGTVTLDGADPSPIVVDNCHENCAGTVPKCASGGSCPP
jgi:hypothetical protein